MPVAVITGSSSGIGQATAIKLAANGYSVVLHARHNIAGLQETASQISRNTPGQSCRCIIADIACPRACSDFVQAAYAWQNRIDVWINNAGADVLTTAAKDLPFDQKLQLLFNVDVRGTIRLSQLASQFMHPIDGTIPSIINIGWDQSEIGMEGEPGQLFCTSKSAITAFSRAFAMTVAPGIRVNCVAPGWIKTVWGEEKASEYWNERAISECLLARWGTPIDVASTIAWLATPDSQFVNCECIRVNGGHKFSH